MDRTVAERSATPVPIPARAWKALAVVSLSIFMVVVDNSVVNVAFPTISESLDADPALLSWIISAYTVTIAAFLLIGGRLADRLGNRRVFSASIALFGVGSLLCGLAPNVGLLIAFRIVQALGSAAIYPSSLALVLPEFPDERRSTAIGIWGAMAAAGAASGPTLGALLIEASGWRAIFLINVPIVVLVLVLAPRVLRHQPPHTTGRRIDLLGVPAGTAGVALIMIAIVQIERWGAADLRVVALALAGVLLLPLVVIRSRRHPTPLLDLQLFSIVSFRGVMVSVAFFGSAFLAGFLVNSLLLQDLWGYGVLATGLGITPGSLVSSFVASGTGWFAERIGHRALITTGCGLAAASFGWLILAVGDEPDYLGTFLPANLLLGVGVGMSISTFSSASLQEVRSDRLAIATATIRTVQQMCYALGVAVVITLLGSTGVLGVADFRRAWTWEVCLFLAAGASAAVLLPRRVRLP